MSDAVSTSSSATTFDRGRAVTKSLLGWGVVAGPFYVVVGLAQALLVPGFDLSRHALSLLLLGPLGWIQWLNLVLSGLMVLAATARLANPTAPAARWSSPFVDAVVASVPPGGKPPIGSGGKIAAANRLTP